VVSFLYEKTLIVLVLLIFGIITIVLSHEEVPLLPELAMLIGLWLMIKNRHSIAQFFNFKKVPEALLMVIAVFPFMMFEENINCFPPEAGGCQLFPITYPFLIAEVLIIYWLVRKFSMKRFWLILSVASFLGVVWEITIGVSGAAFLALPPLWIFIIAAWTWLSYAIVFLIPLTLQLDRKKARVERGAVEAGGE